MSKVKTAVLLATALVALFQVPSIALADVTVISAGAKVTTAHPGMAPTIGISGEIRRGDAKLFAALLPTMEANARKLLSNYTGTPIVVIDLNSLGGDVVEAEKIGRLIRSHFLYTRVSAGSTCASACVFILVGGVVRTVVMPAAIGLHRPFFDPGYFAGLGAGAAIQKYNAMLEDVRHYLADMGMPDDLFRDMRGVASQDAKFLTAEEVDQLGLNGEDAAWEEFEQASLSNSIGADGAARMRRCEQASSTMAEIAACLKKR